MIKKFRTDGISISVSQYFSITIALLNKFKNGVKVRCPNDPAAPWIVNLDPAIRQKPKERKYKSHLRGVSTKLYN